MVAVKVQPTGYSVQYPKTRWRVIFVEHSSGKFYFRLSSKDFWFEPRDCKKAPAELIATVIPVMTQQKERLTASWN